MKKWLSEGLIMLMVFQFFVGWVPQKAYAVFACDQNTISVPNGSETWSSGVQNNITWSKTIDNGNPYTGIDIYYSTDSGSTFPNLIIGNTTDDGQYEWTPPLGINSSTVQIQIVGRQSPNNGCDENFSTGVDQSDANFSINDPVAVTSSIKNTLSNSEPGSLVDMTIEFEPSLTTGVTDGSIKLTLADEFDFTGISKADVSASGGDVTWSTDEIITVDGSIIVLNNWFWINKAFAQGEDSIVFPFTGTLDYTDKPITFTINGATSPSNPSAIGSYGFDIGIYSSADGTGSPLETKDGKVAIVETVNVTATVPSSLTFVIDGVTSGNVCANSGGNATVTSTSTTIPFGVYTGAQTKIACQTLTVSTNATNGYVVTVEQDLPMTSAGADTLKAFSGTYGTPISWTSPPGSGTESYFGFTTDDTGYSDFQTSKYAAFGANNTPYNIMTGPEPVINEENVVSYQLEVTALQEAGTYSNTVMYVATATF